MLIDLTPKQIQILLELINEEIYSLSDTDTQQIHLSLLNEMLNEELDNYDPSPYCSHCGAKSKKHCNCGPIAENN